MMAPHRIKYSLVDYKSRSDRNVELHVNAFWEDDVSGGFTGGPEGAQAYPIIVLLSITC